MRTYTQAERCMLLLFSPLAGEKALSAAEFQRMEKNLSALGPAMDRLDGDVTVQELVRLGLEPQWAEHILFRLDQEDALDRKLKLLAGRGIMPVTRISEEYPARIRQVLGPRGPMLLYCAGNPALFQRECVSLVGSRRLRPAGARFARALGAQAAREGLVYVSGGASGADTVGFESAMEQGGSAILFLPDSLVLRMRSMKRLLETGRLLLVSEYGYAMNFSGQRAYARNRLIHAMGQKVFVAQADHGKGGTWNGVIENLKNGWSQVFMCADEPEDAGTRGLIERGCQPVRKEELKRLRPLNG